MKYSADINLIPRKKVNKKAIRAVLLTLIILILAGAVGYMGIYFPNRILQGRLDEEKRLLELVSTGGDLQAKIDEKTAELESLRAFARDVDAFQSPVSLYTSLLTCRREGKDLVEFRAINITVETIILEGTAITDSAIQKFAYKLRDSGIFAEVLVDILQPETDQNIIDIYKLVDPDSTGRAFNITVKFPDSQVTADGEAGEVQAN